MYETRYCRAAPRVHDAERADGMARRTAGELAYEPGIERGTPDVSIAREMDTPFHRVLLSGLVYARARLTAGPCLNRRSREASQPASQLVRAASPHLVWVFYVDIIDSVLLFVAALDPPASGTSGCRAT